MDPEEQGAFRALVREQGLQRTLLVCTHVLDEAQAIADTVAVLVAGEIRFRGTLDELLATAADAIEGDRVRGIELAYLRLVHGAADRVS